MDDATRLVLGLVHFARLARFGENSDGVTCAESMEILEIPSTRRNKTDAENCPRHCFVFYLIEHRRAKNKTFGSEIDEYKEYNPNSFSDDCSSMESVLPLLKAFILRPIYLAAVQHPITRSA